MAQPANTFDTYDSTGIREDLIDIIYNIAPTATPFMSNIGRGNASQTLHEWQTDTLATAAANAQVEGDDYTGDALTPTSRLGNRTQISSKTVVVSGTDRAVNNAGRGDELPYQVAKVGKELKRDMETVLCGAPKAAVTGSNAVARELANLGSWVATNTDGGGGYAAPTGDGTDIPTDGTPRAAAEADLKETIRLAWEAGAEPDMVMLGSFNKQAVSGFSGIATQFKDIKPNNLATIIGAADVYVSDFGQLMIVPNRFQRTRDGWVLQTDMWKVCYLRGFQVEELAKTGDNDKKLLTVEYTLQASEEASSAAWADLTVA